ncbi:MAG: hypothetical protein FJX75_09045 [Armatimonadetes bacterium]|nr:hypothetical protein [Armatimonadota bacterium]
MLSRQTSVEELLSDRVEERNAAAFEFTYNHLKIVRPGLTINNFNDALNVAFAVRIFNSPASIGPGRAVPTLISATHDLAGLASEKLEAQWLADAPEEVEAPILLHRKVYLIVMGGLLARAHGHYAAAANEATVLGRQLLQLEGQYLKMLAACREATARGKPEREVTLDDVPPRHLALAVRAREALSKRWRDVLYPVHLLPEHDRLASLKQLFSPEVKALLGAEASDAVRSGLTHVETHLRECRHPGLDLWEPLELLGRTKVGVEYMPSVAVALSVVPDDGAPLCRTRSAKAVERVEDLRALCERSMRVIALPQEVSAGALLSVAPHYGSASQELAVSITWRHRCSPGQIWDSWQKLVATLSGGDPGSIVAELRLFSPDARVDTKVELAATEAFLAETIGAPNGLDYMECSVPSGAVFADLEPLEGVEHQMGIVLPWSAWNRGMLHALARVICGTHPVRLPVRDYANILSRCIPMPETSGAKQR